MSSVLEPKATATPETPWLGLKSFTESDSHYFFGRDQEIQELTNRILHRQLTVLFGQSGLGKTSLVQAGVAPQLRAAGYQPVLVRLIHDPAILELELEQQVLKEIAARFVVADAVPATEAQSMWELFHDVRFGFVGRPTNPPRPVLAFDQFEEIFTLGHTKRPTDAGKFIESLACLVENRPPQEVLQRLETDEDYATQLKQSAQPCRVLLSMRSDFLHHLERYRQRMPSMMDNRMELRRLSGLQAFEAVFRPGQRRVTEQAAAKPILNQETAESIVRLVAGKAAEIPLSEIENVPPLLSLICEQLNLHRHRQGKATIDNADVQGSADEVLRDFVSQCFQAYPPAIRQFVEERLISSGGFRESVNLETAVSELSEACIANPDQVLRSLVNERLLTIEDRGGIPRIELTHDILAPVIVRLRSAGAPVQALQQAYLIYDSLGDESSRERLQKVTQHLFRSLSEIAANGQINSRAITVQRAAKEIGVSESDVLQVARDFVGGGVLLVMDNTDVLTSTTQLQVVHKSLFNQWNLLRTWIDEEAKAAADYRRLVGLVQSKVKRLDDVSLADFIQWRDRTLPTEEWAQKYDEDRTTSPMLQPCLDLISSSKTAKRLTTRRYFLLRNSIIGAFIVLFFAMGIQWRKTMQAEEKAKKEAEQNAVSADVDRVARSMSLYGQTYDAQLAEKLVDGVTPERLGWEWNYLESRFGPLYREVGKPINYGGDLLAVAVNSSGNLVAAAHKNSVPGKLKGPAMRSQSQGSTLELLEFSDGILKATRQLKFESNISALAFSRNDTLAVGDEAGHIELRNLELDPVATEIASFESRITQLAFCLNDSSLAVLAATKDYEIKKDIATKLLSKSIDSPKQSIRSSFRLLNLKNKTKSVQNGLSTNLTSLAVSPDQHWAAVTSEDASLLFDMRSPTVPPAVLRNPYVVTDLAFHPSGQWLGVASDDGSILLYPIPLSSKELIDQSLGQPETIPNDRQWLRTDNHEIAFDLRGEVLLSARGRGVQDFIDVRSLATIEGNRALEYEYEFKRIGTNPSWGNVHLAAHTLSGPQPYLLTQDNDHSLRVWNWSPVTADASTIICPNFASQLAVSPSGKAIAVATDEDVQLFETLTGLRLVTFKLPAENSVLGYVNVVNDSPILRPKRLGFSNEKTLLLADDFHQCVWMIDLSSESEKESVMPKISLDERPTCIAVSPAVTDRFAVGLSSGDIHIYDNRRVSRTFPLAGESPRPLSLEFSRDGKLLLIGGRCSNDEDEVGFLQIVDLEHFPQATVALPAPQSPVHHLLYHFNQRSFYMAEAEEGMTKVSRWDIGPDLQIIENRSFPQLSQSNQCVGLCALSPPQVKEGETNEAHRIRIMGTENQILKLWNAENSREIFSTTLDAAPIALATSHDGRTAASLDQNGVVHVWEAPNQLSPELLRTAYNKVHNELDQQPLLKDVAEKVRSVQNLPPEARDWQLRLLQNQRGFANVLAHDKVNELNLLHIQVLQFVARPALPKTTYEPFLARAMQLCELVPNSSKYRLALGVAEYRSELFERALTTLEPIAASSDTLDSKIAGIFLAMTRIELRQTEAVDEAFELLVTDSQYAVTSNNKVAPEDDTGTKQWYLDAKSELRSLIVPDMSIVDAQFERTGTEWTVNTTLQLKAEKPDFQDHIEYSLWVNGKQVATQPTTSDDKLRLTWSSAAVPDANPVILEAKASLKGQPQAFLARSQVTRQVDSAARGKLHLLLCGSNKWENSVNQSAPSLRFPEKDVRDLHQCLLQKAAGLYEMGEVVLLSGPTFNKSNFMNELRRLSSSLKGASSNDLFVVFHSGFGSRQIGNGFALNAAEQSILWPDVVGLLTLPCEVLVILDSSYSGLAAEYTSNMATEEVERLNVMSACRGNQTCGDGDENGIFSGLIIKGLNGAADTSSDQIVTLQELFEYVLAKSPDSQQPQLFKGSQDRSLALTLVNQNSQSENSKRIESR